MKAKMYWAYATRSLMRGGQRTLLAIFCVAVGVMAIVGLQLVGNSVDGALTSNVRAGNGGDVSVRSDIVPLTAKDLQKFATLQSQGVISNYTAISEHNADVVQSNGKTEFFILRAVDPAHFPLTGAPIFQAPSNGTVAAILNANEAIITSSLQSQIGAQLGDAVTVQTNDGTTMHATIGGIVASDGYFKSAQMLVSLDAFAAAPNSAGLPVNYSVVYVNVPGHSDAAAASAKTAIEQQLPLATVTTTKDALQQQQSQVQNIRYFLQIVGLLALLIGGVGIINTMQVLLRRRQTEIAMLKTAGYQRHDLYVLFGLEAGILGIVGGVVGAAAGIGAAAVVQRIVTGLFSIALPNGFSPLTVASGVAIGFFTALIFGLIPIVQASQVRPLAVLRGLVEGSGGGSVLVTLALSVVLVVLFFLLALSILQNLGIALGAVAGTGIFLLVLSGVFTLVVIVVSKLPVPEHVAWWYVLIILAGLLVSAAITRAVPAFGILFAAVSVLGVVVLVLPRTWKSNVKMAVRNLGRQPGRTVTTLIALFIGVFAIGLILVLGQNIKDKINNALASNLQYNSVIVASSKAKPAVDSELRQITGIQGEQINTTAAVIPISINGVPIAHIVGNGTNGGTTQSGASKLGREEALSYLTTPEGYDLAQQQVPNVTIVRGAQDTQVGRNLSAADANTTNAIMPQRASLAPLDLKLGDTITVASQQQAKPITLTVMGFYSSSLTLSGNTMSVDSTVLDTLAAGNPTYVYQLKINPTQSTQVLNEVQAAVPTVQTFSVAQLTVIVNSLLNDLIVMLTSIASLALIAGIIIIANAVALAMLERRRELGILKSVGYTSRSVLSEVLMENGAIGFLGGLLAMLLVTLALTVLGKLVFKTDFGFGVPVVLGIVLASAALCMLISGLVAWSATRVRPLDVLRYE